MVWDMELTLLYSQTYKTHTIRNGSLCPTSFQPFFPTEKTYHLQLLSFHIYYQKHYQHTTTEIYIFFTRLSILDNNVYQYSAVFVFLFP